jgi:hypothetical protein
MKRAGSKVITNWPSTVFFGTPASLRVNARHRPVNALLPCGESFFATGVSATLRSLSGSGGIRSGLNFASTMT